MSEKPPLTIEIDGQEFEATPGSMLIEVADKAGIYIPRFCYHNKLSVAANCRMCLVEVEKAPKPLPACATPVMNGMKVHTMSNIAVQAQKDTLEFLLINHPLDCPICDQGGECPLQDQAVGYGGHASRFDEKKRVVADHNIGPLIETEMTRCIHCTRCVRFGEEIAGVMELGITGRGEHLKIDTFFDSAVDSEISGNVIDLCPVGALTSKPYRFSARSWELIDHDSISPHDCLGTNISIQTLRNEVKRVLPRVNESINECWISDRDRYSYDALIQDNRLDQPLVRTKQGMTAVSWQDALDAVTKGLSEIIEQKGAGEIGALMSPTATFEEFYLMQKLMRALGSGNVDHRLRQIDFSAQESAPLYPGSQIPIESFSKIDRFLLLGSNIRKEQPILGLKVRKATLNGAKVACLNAMDWQYNFPVAANVLVSPGVIPYALARILLAACKIKGVEFPQHISEEFLSGTAQFSQDEQCHEAAKVICEKREQAAIVMGHAVISHPMYSCIERLAHHLGEITGASIVVLPPANSVAGWVGGCVPHRLPNGQADASGGFTARQMIHNPRTGYLLFNVEPSKDMADGLQAAETMTNAGFVVSFQSFDDVPDYVDVALPIAPFTENSGTFINCEGVVQKAVAPAPPVGQARPGWKILRVLGNMFNLPGFDYITTDDVVNEAAPQDSLQDSFAAEFDDSEVPCVEKHKIREPGRYELISDPLIYSVDSIVRRSSPLQQTADAIQNSFGLHPDDMRQMGIEDGQSVTLCHELHCVQGQVVSDARVSPGSIYFPAASACCPSAAYGAEVRLDRGSDQ